MGPQRQIEAGQVRDVQEARQAVIKGAEARPQREKSPAAPHLHISSVQNSLPANLSGCPGGDVLPICRLWT